MDRRIFFIYFLNGTANSDILEGKKKGVFEFNNKYIIEASEEQFSKTRKLSQTFQRKRIS